MKIKLIILTLLLVGPPHFFAEMAPIVDSALAKKISDLEVKTKSLYDSISHLKKVDSILAGNYYVADLTAIDDFNKRKDSVYGASFFLFVKCKHADPKCVGSCKKVKQRHSCFSTFTFWAAFLIFVVVWFLAIKYALTSTICKADSNLPLKEVPYSYSRVQLFFWTMIIISLYIYFFAFSGILLPLNMTTVTLLGAGLLVYSGGKIIDKRQSMNLGGQPPTHPTDGFLFDILSDETGINIHRFQSLVFNLIYGIGFIILFLKNVNNCLYPFPEFGGWQFALLGISSAAYLGMKTTENDPSKINKSETPVSGRAIEESTTRDIGNH